MEKVYDYMKEAIATVKKRMEESDYTEPIHVYNYECLIGLLYLSLHELKSHSDKYYVRMPEYLNNELIDFWIDNDIPGEMPVNCQVKSLDYLSPEVARTYAQKAYNECPNHQLVIIGNRKDDIDFKGIKLVEIDKMLSDLSKLMDLRKTNYLVDFLVAGIDKILKTDAKKYKFNMDTFMLEKKRKSCELRGSFLFRYISIV